MILNFFKKINYKKVVKWVIILAIILFVIFIGLLLWARQPISNAKHQSTSLAERKIGIKKVDHFYMSDINRTYYTIKGSDKNNNKVYAIIEKKTGNIVVQSTKSAISAEQAEQITNQRYKISKLIGVAPTIYNGKAAWSVSYFGSQNELNYAIVDFKTGKIVRFIANI